MRVIGAIGHVVKPRTRHFGGFQNGLGLCGRLGAGPGGDGFVKLGNIVAAEPIGGEARRIRQFGLADRGHQPAEDQIRIAGNAQPFAIGAGVGVGRRGGFDGSTLRLTHPAEKPIFRQHTLHERKHAADQIHIHHAALGIGVALHRPAGRNHGQSAVNPGQIIADGNPAARRRQPLFARMAREVPEAPHRFPNRAKGRLVLIGTILPIARNPPDHEARVFLMQHIRPKPHAFQIAGAEILNQPIGAAEQRDQLRAIIRLFQIKRDAEFIAPMHAEPDGIAIDIAAPTAHRVPARGFDLDHLSAEVREQARGERGGNVMAELHELEAGKGEVGSGGGHGPGVAENGRAGNRRHRNRTAIFRGYTHFCRQFSMRLSLSHRRRDCYLAPSPALYRGPACWITVVFCG